jgi:hypothetical protein
MNQIGASVQGFEKKRRLKQFVLAAEGERNEKDGTVSVAGKLA